jgi:hypothetical protein
MNRFYVRKFLNRAGHHGGAYVLGVVTKTEPSDEHDSYANLELSDCSRRVSFDFPMWTARERENSVRKARLLADALTRFADAVAAEAELARVRKRRPYVPSEGSLPLEQFLAEAEAGL